MDTKTINTDLKNKTVAELVASDFRTANVFKKHGIDFCCGGKRTLAEVCEKNQVDLDSLQDDLQTIGSSPAETPHLDFNQWEMDFLSDYIVNVHHKYVRDNIPPLLEYIQKVARVHGETNPEVIQIARLFEDLAAELHQHMAKEEQILFPYIRQLTHSRKTSQAVEPTPFGSVENPITMMEHEHDVAGKFMKEIRRLSGDFNFPENACNTYRVSYLKLNEFEDDLHRHIHLENNILFPKAIEAEQNLQKQN